MKRRASVPAEGYYEWQKTEDEKIPELWLTGITEHRTAEGKL